MPKRVENLTQSQLLTLLRGIGPSGRRMRPFSVFPPRRRRRQARFHKAVVFNGLGWTQTEHRRELRNILRKDVPASLHTLKQARTCTHSLLLFQDAVRAREQDVSRRGFKSNKVSPKVATLMKRAESALLRNCRERSNRITDFGAREPLRRRA